MEGYNKYTEAKNFSTEDCLSLFDKIPNWRQAIIDDLANNVGMSSEILRNAVEITSEEPDKIKRLGELLITISEKGRYSEDVEDNEIPEKIKELIDLVK